MTDADKLVKQLRGWHTTSGDEAAAEITRLTSEVENADALAEASGQCLDDMGEYGKKVCLASKERLRAALAAFKEGN